MGEAVGCQSLNEPARQTSLAPGAWNSKWTVTCVVAGGAASGFRLGLGFLALMVFRW